MKDADASSNNTDAVPTERHRPRAQLSTDAQKRALSPNTDAALTERRLQEDQTKKAAHANTLGGDAALMERQLHLDLAMMDVMTAATQSTVVALMV